MRKTVIAAAVALGATLLAPPAYATEPPPLKWADCGNLRGWYVNEPDEASRKPTPTVGGLEFKGNQLIHRETTGLKTKDLKPGTFAAAPAPDQDSFFSVEVNSGPGTYATLRWNTATSKWNMVTAGQFYENADPDALVDMPPIKKSHDVVSFGVGYTNSPPGTVTTVVSSVTFRGVTYDLTCKPKPEPSASVSTSASPSPSTSVSASPSTSVSPSVSVSPSASVSASPSPSVTASTTPTVSPSVSPEPGGVGGEGGKPKPDGGLPVTGPGIAVAAGAGALLLAVGVVGLIVSRRRRTRFTA